MLTLIGYCFSTESPVYNAYPFTSVASLGLAIDSLFQNIAVGKLFANRYVRSLKRDYSISLKEYESPSSGPIPVILMV